MNKFKNIKLGLMFSFSYFSILPISFKKEDDLSKKDILNYMLFFFPFVGFILGLITLTILNLTSNLHWLSNIIAAIVYMILYGFLHTEAILDVVDAIYAKHSNKDAYKVIKDPTVGAMGVLYSISFVLLKISFLIYLFLNHYEFYLFVVLMLSRLMVLYNIKLFDFKSSFVGTLKSSLSTNCLIFSTLFVSILSIFIIGLKFLWLFIFSFIFLLIVSNLLKNKLGFLNGDTIGATLELNELFMIFILLVFIV